MAGTKFLKPVKTRLSATSTIKSDEEEPLSPIARLFNAPQFSPYVIAVMGCSTRMDVEVIKEGLKHTLIKHPRFSSKLAYDIKKGDTPVSWIQTKVIVDDHIIVPDLDSNVVSSPEQFLEDYVSNITTTSMDFSKPLWEIHLLNIKTSDANGIAVLRIHHSMGDGVSLMSLVLACTRQTANPEALPTLPTAAKRKIKPPTSSSFALMSWFLAFLFTIKLLLNTLIDLALFVATALWLKDTRTPVKGAPGTEFAPKRFVYRTFSLDDIKLLKMALDVTINDVLMGITQAGLSNYLNRKYGDANGKGNVQGNNLPKHIRLRSTFLFNLRPTSTVEGLAEMMESETKGKWNWGNAIGYAVLPFHISLRDDPLDYIRAAKAAIDRKKQSLEPQCTYATAKITLKTLGLQALTTLTYRVLSNTTLSFSNIVGPKQEISFYGHPIVYLVPSVYGHPQALTVHFQSYVDKMTLVLAVDKAVIPDPQRLCDDIEESLTLAKKAVIDNNLNKS